MSQHSLIVTETLAQDEYQAYESIEVESVVGTARERTLPPVGPLAREVDGAIFNQTALEAEVAQAWAAVHARLSRPSTLPGPRAAVVAESAPEWAAVHAQLNTPVPATWAEGSRAHAPRPVRRPAVIVPERQPARRSLVGFTAEDEAFFREGESLADPRNYDFTDLDRPEPASRRSRQVPVARLRYNA